LQLHLLLKNDGVGDLSSWPYFISTVRHTRKFEPISKRTRNVRSGSAFGLASALLFSVCNFSRLRARVEQHKEQTISILTEKWNY